MNLDLKKLKNFERKIKMQKADLKTAILSTQQNFDVIEKNGCRIRNQLPKIDTV